MSSNNIFGYSATSSAQKLTSASDIYISACNNLISAIGVAINKLNKLTNNHDGEGSYGSDDVNYLDLLLDYPSATASSAASINKIKVINNNITNSSSTSFPLLANSSSSNAYYSSKLNVLDTLISSPNSPNSLNYGSFNIATSGNLLIRDLPGSNDIVDNNNKKERLQQIKRQQAAYAATTVSSIFDSVLNQVVKTDEYLSELVECVISTAFANILGIANDTGINNNNCCCPSCCSFCFFTDDDINKSDNFDKYFKKSENNSEMSLSSYQQINRFSHRSSVILINLAMEKLLSVSDLYQKKYNTRNKSSKCCRCCGYYHSFYPVYNNIFEKNDNIDSNAISSNYSYRFRNTEKTSSFYTAYSSILNYVVSLFSSDFSNEKKTFNKTFEDNLNLYKNTNNSDCGQNGIITASTGNNNSGIGSTSNVNRVSSTIATVVEVSMALFTPLLKLLSISHNIPMMSNRRAENAINSLLFHVIISIVGEQVHLYRLKAQAQRRRLQKEYVRSRISKMQQVQQGNFNLDNVPGENIFDINDNEIYSIISRYHDFSPRCGKRGLCGQFEGNSGDNVFINSISNNDNIRTIDNVEDNFVKFCSPFIVFIINASILQLKQAERREAVVKGAPPVDIFGLDNNICIAKGFGEVNFNSGDNYYGNVGGGGVSSNVNSSYLLKNNLTVADDYIWLCAHIILTMGGEKFVNFVKNNVCHECKPAIFDKNGDRCHNSDRNRSGEFVRIGADPYLVIIIRGVCSVLLYCIKSIASAVTKRSGNNLSNRMAELSSGQGRLAETLTNAASFSFEDISDQEGGNGRSSAPPTVVLLPAIDKLVKSLPESIALSSTSPSGVTLITDDIGGYEGGIFVNNNSNNNNSNSRNKPLIISFGEALAVLRLSVALVDIAEAYSGGYGYSATEGNLAFVDDDAKDPSGDNSKVRGVCDGVIDVHTVASAWAITSWLALVSASVFASIPYKVLNGNYCYRHDLHHPSRQLSLTTDKKKQSNSTHGDSIFFNNNNNSVNKAISRANSSAAYVSFITATAASSLYSYPPSYEYHVHRKGVVPTLLSACSAYALIIFNPPSFRPNTTVNEPPESPVNFPPCPSLSSPRCFRFLPSDVEEGTVQLCSNALVFSVISWNIYAATDCSANHNVFPRERVTSVDEAKKKYGGDFGRGGVLSITTTAAPSIAIHLPITLLSVLNSLPRIPPSSGIGMAKTQWKLRRLYDLIKRPLKAT